MESTTTTGLLRPQTHVYNLLFSYLKSMSLKAAIELRIPDVLHKNEGKPMPLSELSTALSIIPERTNSLRRLMRGLVHMGVFASSTNDDAEDAYVLTPTSRLLVAEESIEVSPFVRLFLDPVILDSSRVLASWFSGPQVTPFELVNGKGMWDLANEKPEYNQMFNEGMASDTRLVVEVMMKTCGHVFAGLRSLVDVGGGTGTMARAVAKAFPEIKCTVFDLPHVIETVEPETGVEYVAGDMFTSVPKANAVLLKWILHDWSDEECIKILKNCKKAIPPREKNGKIIIIDIVVGASIDDDAHIVETQHLFDLVLMTFLTGKEREENEWQKIILAASFTEYKIAFFLGFRSIIEIYA